MTVPSSSSSKVHLDTSFVPPPPPPYNGEKITYYSTLLNPLEIPVIYFICLFFSANLHRYITREHATYCIGTINAKNFFMRPVTYLLLLLFSVYYFLYAYNSNVAPPCHWCVTPSSSSSPGTNTRITLCVCR